MKYRMSLVALSIALMGSSGFVHASDMDKPDHEKKVHARTPIRHVIVIIGENHSFDNVFGAYQPKHSEAIRNLLSEGIVNADGTPGPNFSKALQNQASDLNRYSLEPAITQPFPYLPQPQTTYAFGQPPGVPDARFPANLPSGPFQITRYVPYQNAYLGDPVHRFFQMWQQVDGGKMDLFAWVDKTVGIGPQNSPPAPTPANTYSGGEALGFYNMSAGDVPEFKALADRYAISDNYHQFVMGGTGANFISIASADVAFHNQNGAPDMPPANQIENPDPQPGTNNFYIQDGYGGGSYVDCADSSQPGVSQIRNYVRSQPGRTFRGGNCAPRTYYLLNNYAPGYTPSGELNPLGPTHFTLPPQYMPTIADALSAKGVSWKWYSGGRADGVNPTNQYCNICDPFTFFKSVMTGPMKSNLQDVTQFYQDVQDESTLPAVSFIRPFESQAGHPADSTLSAYEGFVMDIINRVKSDRKAWESTAIIITTDEGGGYYDSGYIQPIDFFGDGTRIPLIVVSPYAKKGHVDHVYADHASILKFIEKNWDLKPLSHRSRDSLPNPVASDDNPYVPLNKPALGDLMNMFDFEHDRR